MMEHTVRVSCDCEVCKVNAERVGAAFPLVAYIRPLAAKNLGVTARNADNPRKVHGFVYTAYDPSLAGLPVSRRFAVAAL